MLFKPLTVCTATAAELDESLFYPQTSAKSKPAPFSASTTPTTEDRANAMRVVNAAVYTKIPPRIYHSQARWQVCFSFCCFFFFFRLSASHPSIYFERVRVATTHARYVSITRTSFIQKVTAIVISLGNSALPENYRNTCAYTKNI